MTTNKYIVNANVNKLSDVLTSTGSSTSQVIELSGGTHSDTTNPVVINQLNTVLSNLSSQLATDESNIGTLQSQMTTANSNITTLQNKTNSLSVSGNTLTINSKLALTAGANGSIMLGDTSSDTVTVKGITTFNAVNGFFCD